MSVFGLTPFFTSPLNPLLSPFGADIFDALNASTPSRAPSPSASGRGSDYNIERLSDTDYRISVLASGLDDSDIDIEEKGGTLTIRAAAQGAPQEEASQEESQDESQYIHQGLHPYGFTRHFHLDEHIHVSDAYLDKGLLYINLTRDVPEAEKTRKISLAKAVKA